MQAPAHQGLAEPLGKQSISIDQPRLPTDVKLANKAARGYQGDGPGEGRKVIGQGHGQGPAKGVADDVDGPLACPGRFGRCKHTEDLRHVKGGVVVDVYWCVRIPTAEII